LDYTSAEQRGQDVALTGIQNFDTAQVVDNGQCFRWQGNSGIAHGRRLTLDTEDGALILRNVTLDEYERIWRDYFDLGRDYGKLRKTYTADGALAKATEFSPGLRLMKQEPWETLISFILSQNSNIPRIKGMVERLCENFGKPLSSGYAFPTAEALADADLTPIRSGYRADYIKDAAKRAADGRLNLAALEKAPTEEVRKALTEIHGVGPKVADCVLLYGFGRTDRFPLDVWMKRVMIKYYPNGFPQDFAATAGIAQQFLFHYIRNNKEEE